MDEKEAAMYRVIKPRYWQLAILCTLVMGLFIFTNFYWHVSEQIHTSVNVCMVLWSYGVFQFWLAFNSGAVEREQETHQDEIEGKVPAISLIQTHYRNAIRHRIDNAQ